MTQTEALRLALEALKEDRAWLETDAPTEVWEKNNEAITTIKAALEAKDEPHKWKLVPIEPTDEMLKAMDECSIEGYDERLYAGYAASVYMAAVDVAPSPSQQHAEDIAKLGWQYFECPACGSEGARAFPKQEVKDEPVAHSVVAGALFDFMGWLTSREKRLILSSVDEASPAVEAITEFAIKRNLSLKYAEVGYWTEFLATPPQQEAKDEPVALKMDVIVVNLVREGINKHRARELAEHFIKHTTTPPQRKEPEPVVWMYQDKSTHEVRFQKHMRGFVDHGATYETPLYTTPPQRKPLTDDEITLIIADCASSHQHTDIHLARAIEQAHGIKGEA